MCKSYKNNNKLTDQNIENIVKTFIDRKDIDYVSRLVSNKEIGENDYNLSVSTYVEKEDTREKIDIDVLNKEIDEIVARENVLREEIKQEDYRRNRGSIMSKLDELINQLCPDGIKYKTLEEVTKGVNIGINPRKFLSLIRMMQQDFM